LFIPISSHTHITFSGYIGCNGNLIGNFYSFAKTPPIPFYISIHEILVVATADWQIIKDQERSNIRCRCPLAQSSSSQEKGSEKHQDPAEALEDNTIFSTSSGIPDPNSILSFSIGSPDTRSTFPPRSVPQSQEAPTDVSEQIADSVDLGTSSVAPPEQTISIPPQGKVLITELLPMNLSIS